jgi:GDP-L-fucose synthase
MRILITGANGYIGKTLHNALRDTHYVVAINRSNFDLTDAVAMSKFFTSKHHFDVVLHCAVAGAANPRDTNLSIMDKNLTAYYNLLQFRKHYTRLIHFGSGAETYLTSTPYGYSKKVIAKSILNQDNFYNLKIFGVFDENELETRFIKANILRYIKKEPIQIHKDRVMDFFYMQDLVKVVDYYVNQKDPPKEFDCVYEDKCTLGGIATMINNCSYPDEVEIQIQEEGFDLYMSKYRDPLPIELIGLAQGIKNVYNKLKNETN